MRLILVTAICLLLGGCGIGALYCPERDQRKPSPICDVW